MKTKRANRKRFLTLARAAALSASAGMFGFTTIVADDAKPAAKPSDSSTEADDSELLNWIEFGVGGNFIKGNKAQYQHQKGVKSGAFGGIESFHYEQPVNQKGLLSLDGHALFDYNDYSFNVSLSDPDKGFVRAGYSSFRTYYDGTGGYLPSNGLIFPGLVDKSMAVDRTHAYFEAGLTVPDFPEVVFRYDMETRNGLKDSTSWGQTILTPGGDQKKISPSFRDLDETRHLFSLDVKHHVGNTEFGLGGRYEIQKNNDDRSVIQSPNEGTASRVLKQTEGVSADISSLHAFTDTKFNDTFEFTTGYSFTSLHSALSGYRTDTPIVTPLSSTDTRFANLAGGSDLKEYVMNLNLAYTPGKNWYIVPSLRVEKRDLDGSSTDNAITGTATQTVSPTTAFASSEQGALYVTEGLDIRYLGITNWVFYMRSELSEDQANLNERFGADITLPPTTFRNTDWERLKQKHAVGANWYPSGMLNFAAQYYHKISDNDYTDRFDSTPNDAASRNRYPAYLGSQNFDVDDVNFRMTWHPMPLVNLVTRYDFQLSRSFTQPDQLPEVESAVNERHIISQSVAWTPLNWLYVQATGNYVLSTTDSPVEDLSGAASGVVLSAPNNYWTAGATLGFTLDKKTDLQTSYSYYRADNYVDNSLVGLPYGSGAKQHEVSATLTRQISRRMRWKLSYAFSSYHDQTSGGALNYEAHGILSTIQYRF